MFLNDDIIQEALSYGEPDKIAPKIIRDSLKYNGVRVLTFSNVIKYNRFPINDIIIDLMSIRE